MEPTLSAFSIDRSIGSRVWADYAPDQENQRDISTSRRPNPLVVTHSHLLVCRAVITDGTQRPTTDGDETGDGIVMEASV